MLQMMDIDQRKENNMKVLVGAIAATIVLIPSVAKAEWVMVAGNNDALFSVYDGKTVIRGRMAEFYAKLQRNSVNSYAKRVFEKSGRL